MILDTSDQRNGLTSLRALMESARITEGAVAEAEDVEIERHSGTSIGSCNNKKETRPSLFCLNNGADDRIRICTSLPTDP